MSAIKRNNTVDQLRTGTLPSKSDYAPRYPNGRSARQIREAIYAGLPVVRLKALASERFIPGRSTMTKPALAAALAAPSPLSTEQRLSNYQRQNKGRPLTRRQLKQFGQTGLPAAH